MHRISAWIKRSGRGKSMPSGPGSQGSLVVRNSEGENWDRPRDLVSRMIRPVSSHREVMYWALRVSAQVINRFLMSLKDKTLRLQLATFWITFLFDQTSPCLAWSSLLCKGNRSAVVEGFHYLKHDTHRRVMLQKQMWNFFTIHEFCNLLVPLADVSDYSPWIYPRCAMGILSKIVEATIPAVIYPAVLW